MQLLWLLILLLLLLLLLQLPGEDAQQDDGSISPPPVGVQCDTTKGPFEVEVYRDWAPRGADRFLEMVTDGFFTDIAMFRTVDKFLSQFGISDNPQFKASNPNFKFREILDDPDMGLGIKKHYMSFAGSGVNSRSSQVFIAFEDLGWLGPRKGPHGGRDGTWETPFGKVVGGIDTIDHLYRGYAEKPNQQKLHNLGNKYIRENFPLMDFIKECHVFDLNGRDSRGLHELGIHRAAAAGDVTKIRGVHKRAPDAINLPDSNGWNAIHEASRGGHLEAVKYLVNNGADIGARTGINRRMYLSISSCKCVEIASLFLCIIYFLHLFLHISCTRRWSNCTFLGKKVAACET